MDKNLVPLPPLENSVKGPLEAEAEAAISRAIREDEKESTEMDCNGPKLMPKASLSESRLFEEKAPGSLGISHNVSQEATKEVKFTSENTNSIHSNVGYAKLGDLKPQNSPLLSTNDPVHPTTSTPKLKDFARRLHLMEKATRRSRNDTLDKKCLGVQRDSSDRRTAMVYDEQPRQEITTLQETKQSRQTSNVPKLRDMSQRINVMEMGVEKSKTQFQTGSDGSLQNVEGTLPDDDQALHDPESLKPEDMIYTSSDRQNKNDLKLPTRNETETCYRHYCRPCSVLTNFLTLHRRSIMHRIKVFLLIIVPFLALSVLLFYLADNPLTKHGASFSWWFLFCIRQMITFSLAQLSQFLLIDFIALETRLVVRTLGKMFTLMAMQAKGWPIVIVFWAIWNFALLHGSGIVSRHWGFRQNRLAIFNDSNPSGNIVSGQVYTDLLISMIVVGCLVVVKRLLASFMLGKKKYAKYGPEMESIMRKVLLIAEVSLLAEDIEFEAYRGRHTMIPMQLKTKGTRCGWLYNEYDMPEDSGDKENNLSDDDSISYSDVYEIESNSSHGEVIGGDNKEEKKNTKLTSHRRLNWSPFKSSTTKKEMRQMLTSSQRENMCKILGGWEPPEAATNPSWRKASVKKILQFRETLNYMEGPYPLSVSFGVADTREDCMKSSRNVYQRLLMKRPGSGVLSFETIDILALNGNGTLQKDKARALIRLFRPDRDGKLKELDFIKSCDRIFKRLKMFVATISHSAQLDDAFEQLINIVFYFVIFLIVFAIFGVNLQTLFISIAGILLPLSFLFGAAASKFFEGVLLVLARQPYDIGDRIAISDPTNEVPIQGSPSWFVENITLFQTTVRMAATNEVATYANGSLASLRIINAARSPRAIVMIPLKIGLDVEYQKVKIYGNVIAKFVEDRPREWLKLISFRATDVEADLGYIRYVILLQHVESWQNVGDVLQSKAEISSFSLEVSKKMEMRFVAPPMPVDLNLPHDPDNLTTAQGEVAYPSSKHTRIDSAGYQAIAKLFRRAPEESTEKKKR